MCTFDLYKSMFRLDGLEFNDRWPLIQSDDQGHNWQPKTGWASSNGITRKRLKMSRFIMNFLILCPNHNTYYTSITFWFILKFCFWQIFFKCKTWSKYSIFFSFLIKFCPETAKWWRQTDTKIEAAAVRINNRNGKRKSGFTQ